MLSFNCADLILVTYLVTEKHSVSHSQPTGVFSGLNFKAVEAHKCYTVRMELWVSLFVCVYMCRYIVSRLSDSAQLLKKTTSEVLNVHVCVEEG